LSTNLAGENLVEQNFAVDRVGEMPVGKQGLREHVEPRQLWRASGEGIRSDGIPSGSLYGAEWYRGASVDNTRMLEREDVKRWRTRRLFVPAHSI
jgi:hypothetical protein